MSTMPPPAPGPAPVKKTSPLVWILIAVIGLFGLFGIAVVAGGYFVAHKLHQAADNPGLAAAKLIAAANPDVEMLSSDDTRGTITLKDKKTGKIVTLNFEDIKKGKLTMQEEGQEAVSIQASGDGSHATMEAKSKDGGTVKFGAGATKLPAWIPTYPGSSPQANFGMQGAGEDAGNIMFTTKDPIEKVSKFYEDGLKNAGLTTNSNVMQQNGKTAMATLAGEDADKKRTAAVNIVPGDDGVTVTITYSHKK
jgi:hypothetical protein